METSVLGDPEVCCASFSAIHVRRKLLLASSFVEIVLYFEVTLLLMSASSLPQSSILVATANHWFIAFDKVGQI